MKTVMWGRSKWQLLIVPKSSISFNCTLKSQFVSVFRSRVQRLGVSDFSKFRGHSFRRGGATWAFRSGVPGELIQVYGDWASDAYKIYLEFSEDARLRVARRMISAFDE